jgi:hypothetical protein
MLLLAMLPMTPLLLSVSRCTVVVITTCNVAAHNSALCVMDVWTLSCKTLQIPVGCVLLWPFGGCDHLCDTCATAVMHQHMRHCCIRRLLQCTSGRMGVAMRPGLVGLLILGVSLPGLKNVSACKHSGLLSAGLWPQSAGCSMTAASGKAVHHASKYCPVTPYEFSKPR